MALGFLYNFGSYAIESNIKAGFRKIGGEIVNFIYGSFRGSDKSLKVREERNFGVDQESSSLSHVLVSNGVKTAVGFATKQVIGSASPLVSGSISDVILKKNVTIDKVVKTGASISVGIGASMLVAPAVAWAGGPIVASIAGQVASGAVSKIATNMLSGFSLEEAFGQDRIDTLLSDKDFFQRELDKVSEDFFEKSNDLVFSSRAKEPLEEISQEQTRNRSKFLAA